MSVTVGRNEVRKGDDKSCKKGIRKIGEEEWRGIGDEDSGKMGEKEKRRIGDEDSGKIEDGENRKENREGEEGKREKERLRKDKVRPVEVRARSLAIERAFTCSVLTILAHNSFYYYY